MVQPVAFKIDPEVAVLTGTGDARRLLGIWFVRKSFYWIFFVGFTYGTVAAVIRHETAEVDVDWMSPNSVGESLLTPWAGLIFALILRFVVGWIAPDCGGRDANLEFRVNTTALSSYFLRKTRGDRDALREIVEPIMGDKLHLAFLIDLKRNEMSTVWWSGEPVLWQQEKDGRASEHVALGEGVISLEPNTQYLLCRDAGLAHCLSEWEADAHGGLVSHFKEKILERNQTGEPECSAIGVMVEGSRHPVAT